MYLCTLYSFIMLFGMCRKTHTSIVFCEKDVKGLEKSEKSVRQAIAMYFPYGGVLGLVLSKHADMENLFIKMSVPVVLFATNNNTVDCHSQRLDLRGYILVTSCKSSLEIQTLPALNCFNQSSLRLRSKRILILDICLKSGSHDSKRYFSYLQDMWKIHGLIYVSILPIWKISNGSVLLKSVFAYNPFENDETSRLALVEADVDGDFVYRLHQRFRNMNGYKIKALYSPLKVSKRLIGDEGPKISDTLHSFFNLTLEITSGSKYKYEPEERGNDSFYHYMTKNRGDLTLNLFFYINYNSSMIEYLNVKHTNPLVCVVINPPVKTWEIILYAFTKELWNWIGLSYLLICFCAIVFSIFQMSKEKSSVWSRMSTDLSRVCHALLTRSISKLPTRHSERLLLGLSLWVGFMVTTVLLSQIIRFMYSSPQPPVIDTFEELNKLGKKFEPYKVRDILDKHEEELQGSAVKRVSEESSCSDDRQRFIIVRESEANFFDVSSDKGGVYVVRERIFVFPRSYIVRADSFLIEHLNLLHSRLHDSGIYSYWDIREVRVMQSMIRQGELLFIDKCYNENNSAKVLAYGDLKLAFYSLYVGLLLSAISLIIEIITRKLQTYKLFTRLFRKRISDPVL